MTTFFSFNPDRFVNSSDEQNCTKCKQGSHICKSGNQCVKDYGRCKCPKFIFKIFSKIIFRLKLGQDHPRLSSVIFISALFYIKVYFDIPCTEKKSFSNQGRFKSGKVRIIPATGNLLPGGQLGSSLSGVTRFKMLKCSYKWSKINIS